jgi:hypothetical protein
MTRTWPVGPLVLGALVAALAQPANAEDSFQRFREVLIDYFAEQGYLPVIVDRGYRIGDVVNVDGVNLFARAATCFPKLKVPPPVKSSLPDVVRTDGAGLSFGLKLRQMFDSSVGGDLARRIEIKFSEVTVASVTLLDLRAALDRKACPQIAPLVDGTLAPLQPNQAPYFVVSEVMAGQREAKLEFANRADLAVKTKELARLAGSADLSVRASGDGTVSLASKVAGPIAIKPVTVPNVVRVASFAAGARGSESESQLQWQAVACGSVEACWKQVGPLAEQVKAAPLGLSQQELDR